MTNRRKFMMVLGGSVIAAAGAAGSWAVTRDPVKARKPWQTASDMSPNAGDPRRYALSHAILAPNPHNRQPWIADLGTPDEVTLYCQMDRRLPQTDPFDRQITIGLGCFCELLIMAAAEAGYRVEMVPFPDGEPQPRLDTRPVARFRFIADDNVVHDPLFAQVFNRHTNRTAHDTSRQVTASTLAKIADSAISASVGHTNDMVKVAELRKLVWEAIDIELRTYHAAKESIDLLRIGKAEIEANPDGISLPGPLMEGLDMLGLLSREDMLDTTSSTFQQQVAAIKPPYETSMAYLWLVTPGNSRLDQIKAGRDHVRIHLAATAEGLALQPNSQALQEYPEMAEKFDEMRKTLGIETPGTLQMFVRLGYGPTVGAAPRWPLETRIRNA